MGVWDTGLGKGYLAMALSALLFEDGLIDCVLLACEQDKIEEWVEDFQDHTGLEAAEYHGAADKRARIRAALPQVLISTYETFKADLVRKGRVKGRKTEGFIFHALGEQLAGKRVLVLFDEISAKLTNRGSDLYKAWDFCLKHWRKGGLLRAALLDATPTGRGPEGFFNVGRILDPDRSPTVAEFERDYTTGQDQHGNYWGFKNLSRDTLMEPWVTPLYEIYAPIMLRKRKTDPDVAHLFPKPVLNPPIWVELGDRHQDFYEVVRDTFADADEATQRKLFSLMRRIAGCPLSLMDSTSEVGRIIVREVGEGGLRALGNAKLDRLVEYLLAHPTEQIIVFSFFGRSYFPYFIPVLEAVGISCLSHEGTKTKKQRRDTRRRFKAGDAQVFLTSDTGARGINLPNVHRVLEYEAAITASLRTQRFNRPSRLLAPNPTLTMDTLVAAHTVEEGLAKGLLTGAEWNDQLLDSDAAVEVAVTASVRRQLFQIGRPRRR